MKFYKKHTSNNCVSDELTSFQHDNGTALIGKTLLIVNPVAQSGQGSRNGRDAYNILRNKYKQNVELIYTTHQGHATEIAKKAEGFDTLIAIGGDGVVHEIVSGLALKPKKERPKFGVIPVGSGNDFARSLGMSFKASEACDQIVDAYVSPADIGHCNDKVFAETLSFGLDANIALETMERRKKSQEKGFILYAKSGVNQILHNFNPIKFKATLDDGQVIDTESVMLAIQNGPTYGGGFKICPDASISDGLLDICYADFMPVYKALPVFAMAKQGKHVNLSEVHLLQTKSIKIEFEEEIAAQMDGEEYIYDKFDITLEKCGLRVLKYKKNSAFEKIKNNSIITD